MWLLKKFWHADIVYKIYILIILFIVVVATITVVTRYKNAYELEKVNSEQNNLTQNVVNDISKEENLEIKTETIANIENTEEKKEENTPVPEAVSNTGETLVTTPSQKIIKQEAVEEVKVTPKAEAVKQEETKEIQTQSSEKPKEPVKEKVTEENTNENKQEKVEETKPTEEYKINTEMINTMKSVIEKNPSEMMKTHGFEVIVDSSIPELTNQFTYTEQRLKDKITLKFGTIRIYAQDYYYNGHFVSTQCFII